MIVELAEGYGHLVMVIFGLAFILIGFSGCHIALGAEEEGKTYTSR